MSAITFPAGRKMGVSFVWNALPCGRSGSCSAGFVLADFFPAVNNTKDNHYV